MRALNSFYDFRVSPYSYDFLSFLIQAETCRMLRGLDCLDVFIIKGKRENDLGRTKENDQFLQNVIIPSIQLMNSVRNFFFVSPKDVETSMTHETICFPRGYSIEKPIISYSGLNLVVSRIRRDIPGRFNAPKYARQMVTQFLAQKGVENFVTITARELDRDDTKKTRTLKKDEIYKAIQKLTKIGIQPLVIRDTTNTFAKKPLFKNVLECPEASIHLHFRLAMYELARHNLIKISGPAILLLFSDCSSTCFSAIDDNVPSISTKYLNQNYGMVRGSSFPFTRKNINFNWNQETAQEILKSINSEISPEVQAFNEFISPKHLHLTLQCGFKKLLLDISKGTVLIEDALLLLSICNLSPSPNNQIFTELTNKIQFLEKETIPRGTREKLIDIVKQLAAEPANI